MVRVLGNVGYLTLDLLTSLPHKYPIPVQVILIGEPRARMRARIGKYGAFRPAEDRRAQDSIALAVKAASGWTTPSVELLFGARMLFDCSTLQRRDLDNMVKLVLDAATGILWEDDNQVQEITARVRRGMGTQMAQTILNFYAVGTR